ILLFAYIEKNETKKFYSLFSFLFIYVLLTMINGSRGKQIIIIILLFYVFYYKIDKKIKISFIISTIIIAFFGMVLINTIAEIRLLPSISYSIFFEYFFDSIKNNPIGEIISEVGSTIQTPYLIIDQVPRRLPYGLGKTFLYSPFTIFPNLGGILQRFIKQINFIPQIQGSALGGSYIGELYYNFGNFSFFIAPVV